MHAWFTRLFIAVLCALPVYLAVRWWYRRKRPGKVRPVREVALCLFTVFMAGLLALVWRPGPAHQAALSFWGNAAARLQTMQDINFVPFTTIGQFFAGGKNTAFVVNIVANILMFAPFGFGLPLLWRRWQRFWRVLLAGCFLSAGVEFAQFFIGRAVDVDDWLLNVAGVALGYGLWRLAILLAPRLKSLALPEARQSTAENG